MPGRISDEDIQALRERADIAAIVGDYTGLKRAGSRLKGLCPFHQEKTPSFTVDPARGMFHCFGCNEGGDVYHFIQKVEALSFPEAVERLARRSGYELRYEELSPGQRKALGRRTRLVEAMDEAASFFSARLDAVDGEPARRYLKGRGLGLDAARHFRLGWAPDEWDALVRHLQGRGFESKEIADAGLGTQGRQGLIDRFRGRLIFPILEAGGRDVVAFGGRVLPDMTLKTWSGDTPPKYVNSPETEIYKKSSTLYALNWARAEVQRRDTVLVVEGYMDVIGLHLAGVRHAVATCGTALTPEHFRQMEKFARKVVLALDADEAGFAAAEKARALAESAGMREVGVLPLPEGKDPADLAGEGEQAVEAALGSVKTALEFQIEHLLRGADASTPEGQVSAYRATFPLLARIADRVLRYRYIRDVVAPVVRISADHIEAELDAALARGDVGRDAPSAHVPEAPQPPSDLAAVKAARDPQLRLERDVLQAALQHPDLLPDEWGDLTEEDFTAPISRELFSILARTPGHDLDRVLVALPDDRARARVRGLAIAEATFEADTGKLGELVARLRAAAVQRDIDELEERMAVRSEQMSAEERRELSTRHFRLVQRRHELLARAESSGA
jgi:DNA primase